MTLVRRHPFKGCLFFSYQRPDGFGLPLFATIWGAFGVIK